MSPLKIFGLVILLAGALSLAYGGFTYTKDTSAVEIGSIELSVKKKETVNVPMWAGLAAVVLGGGLLAFGSSKD